uniref:hypothetical protein n=1 Tax=Oceanicella sp. SM1341 TaxID=1548889 RepID=UPI001300AF1D
GALFEWTPCLCDIRGETVVRLQNPFVTEFVLDALGHMERKAREGKDGADRSLLSRLRRKMREAGAHAGLTEREEFVIAVQAALRAADVRWTVPNVRAAMDEVSMRTEAGGQLHNVVGALRMPGAAR